MILNISDREVWENSVDPDHTAPTFQRSSLIRVYTVCHSVCIFWMCCPMVKSHFKIKDNYCIFFFQVSEFFWFLWYIVHKRIHKSIIFNKKDNSTNSNFFTPRKFLIIFETIKSARNYLNHISDKPMSEIMSLQQAFAFGLLVLLGTFKRIRWLDGHDQWSSIQRQ